MSSRRSRSRTFLDWPIDGPSGWILLWTMEFRRCKSSRNLGAMDPVKLRFNGVDLMTVGPLFAVPEQWSCNKLLNTFSCNEITFRLFSAFVFTRITLGWLWQSWEAAIITRFERAVAQSYWQVNYSLTSHCRGVAAYTSMAHANMHIMTTGNTKPWWWICCIRSMKIEDSYLQHQSEPSRERFWGQSNDR